jgi:hypothetical protein
MGRKWERQAMLFMTMWIKLRGTYTGGRPAR